MNAPERLEAASLRLDHHGDGLAAFGRRELGALAARWRSQLVPIVYALRGWQGGPHLELIVRDHDLGRLAIEQEAETLREVLAAEPARELDPAAYRRRAQGLAALEGVGDPDLELHAHGSVAVSAEVSPSALTPELQRPWERVLSALFAACAQDEWFTGAELSGPVRRIRTTSIMTELASTHPSGFGYGTMSFRSHAEAFLASTPSPDESRAALEGVLDQERAALSEAIGPSLGGNAPADLDPWRRAFAYGWGCLDSATDSGALTNEGLDRVGVATGRARPGQARSEFHRAIATAGIEDAPQPWFAAYRMLLNAFYRMLPMLDVTPRERYYLCLAVAELGDEMLGEGWSDRLARVRPTPS